MGLRLRSIELLDTAPDQGFPWDLSVVRGLGLLRLDSPVTLLIGENGSGKSTLLEAIAIGAGFNPEGGGRNLRFTAERTESSLHEHLRLAWSGSKKRSFFLRAETFFNMATSYADPELRMPGPLGQLHERSHGQQFLDVARTQFGGNGLVLMDEPESALSFTSQLALVRLMHEAAALGSQFIVATHSPVLTAFPGASIFEVGEKGLEEVHRDDAAPFREMRNFMEAPDVYLHHLLADD